VALPDGAQQVFSSVTRFAALSPSGAVAVGANTYTTNAMMKCTLTPALETGVDLVAINANGDIGSHFKHGDMPKYYNVSLEMITPDPVMSAILSGGTVLTDSTSALSTPGTITATPSITGGSLAAATYGYVVTAANQYGETVASAEVTSAVASGTSGSVALSIATVTGAKYYRWYGRTAGQEQFLAQTTTTGFTDTGALTPFGAIPVVNTTAGPGSDTGYQSAALGIVGNPYGVSIEMWGAAIVNGTQTPNLPWWRWVVPGCRNLVIAQRDFGPVLLPNTWNGQAFENPSWGTGPFGDWQFDSTKVYQYARAGTPTVPASGLSPIAATV
jgi:hypothetical protein